LFDYWPAPIVAVEVQAESRPLPARLAGFEEAKNHCPHPGGFVQRVVVILSFMLMFLLGLPAAAQTQQTIRVKCGGPGFTDSKGHVWSADTGFNGGQVSAAQGSVSGTPDQALYEHGRWSTSNTPPLIYTFPVVDGAYQVNLYFAEMSPAEEHTGARVFDVKLQGNTVFRDLDIFAAVGANKALVKSTDIAVTNGSVLIEFDNITDHAKIEAIEILPNAAAAGPQMRLNFAYPDGTPVAGTLNYTVATSLIKLGGSNPLTNGQATCILFTSPQVMGLVGQFQLTLSLTDSAGHTLWQVGMTMDPTTVNIASVQSSSLNVVVQKL
jgi:hypothetical protein